MTRCISDNDTLFLFHRSMSMLPIASYEEVAQLIEEIDSMVSIEESERVFNKIINTESFQNDYNIKQIYHILSKHTKTIINGYKANLYLMCSLMEYYPQLGRNISDIKFPRGCKFEVNIPEHETVCYTDQFDLHTIKVGTHIHIIHGNKFLSTLSIYDIINDDELMYLCITKYGVFHVSANICVSIRFENIKQFVENNCEHIVMTPVESAIMEDDVDKLQELMADGECNKRIHINKIANDIIDLPCLTLIELSILRGSVKCFKWLYLNGYYKPGFIIERCLIYGGNLEILKIIENDGIFQSVNRIMEYIIERNDIDLFKYWFGKYVNSDYYTVMAEIALQHMNYKVIVYMNSINLLNEFKKSIYRRNKSMFCYTYELLAHIGIRLEHFPLYKLSNELVEFMLNNGYMCDYTDNGEYNTLILAIKNNSDTEAIECIKKYMYPNGIPRIIQKAFLDEFYNTSIVCYKLDEAFRIMDITKEMIDSQIAIDASTLKEYSLADYYMNMSVFKMQPKFVRYLYDMKVNMKHVDINQFIKKNSAYVDLNKLKVIVDIIKSNQ